MASTIWSHFRHTEQKDKSKKSDRGKSESNRGREADTPGEIPALGWKDTLLRVKDQIGKDKVSMLAASMAYYALLACVPALTSLVLLYAWFNDPSQISGHIAEISRFLPAQATEILNSQMTSLASKAPTTLGLSAIVFIFVSL